MWGQSASFGSGAAGIDRYLDDADAVRPGDDPRMLQFAAHREDVGFIPMSDEAAAHRIDINVLPARIDPAQKSDRAGVLADHGHAAGHRRSPAGASAAPVVSSMAAWSASSQSARNRSSPNRSRAVSLAR